MAQRVNISCALYHMFAGPMTWFAHLNVLYAAQTLICSRFTAWDLSTVSVTATVIALAVLGGLGLQLSRMDGSQGIPRFGLALVALSALGIAWTEIARGVGTASC
jgi:hypothetical protein